MASLPEVRDYQTKRGNVLKYRIREGNPMPPPALYMMGRIYFHSSIATTTHSVGEKATPRCPP